MGDFNNLSCNICKQGFGQRNSLRSHIKKFHPGKLEELAPLKKCKSVTVCKACSKIFATKSSLIKHIRRFHKDKLYLIHNEYPYTCDECHKHFTNLRLFKSHTKCHNGHQNTEGCGLKCVLCKNSSNVNFLKKSNLLQHFRKEHDITIITETFHFSSLKEFEMWKKQEETKLNELYVITRGRSNTTGNFTKKYYVCHRSGTYRKTGSGLRKLKTQGSKKINGFCPAEMCVTIENGECEVTYVSTHVGHGNDVRHLYLSKTERQELAAQIASNTPFETILDNVKESMSYTSARSRLLTKKDLFNIKQSLVLNSEVIEDKNGIATEDVQGKEMDTSGGALVCRTQDDEANLTTDENVVTKEEVIKIEIYQSEDNFYEEKENLKLEFMQLVDSVTCFEELDVVKKMLDSLQVTLITLRNSKQTTA